MLYGTHVHDGTIDLDEEIVDIGIDEDDGYALMNSSRDQDVLKSFRLNAELYPNGYNSFDSLGQCLVKLNRSDEAIAAYQTALQLNPGHTDAANSIELLRSGN